MTAPLLPDDSFKQRRRSRNWAVFLGLLVFVLLVYGVTMVKMKLGYAP